MTGTARAFLRPLKRLYEVLLADILRTLLTIDHTVDHPAQVFAEQVLAQIEQDHLPAAWKRTSTPSAIAALVQAHADRQHPFPVGLARQLPRVLDALVDFGDRRSAALQQSESFRGVRLSVPV
jgi:hypothetical protein